MITWPNDLQLIGYHYPIEKYDKARLLAHFPGWGFTEFGHIKSYTLIYIFSV